MTTFVLLTTISILSISICRMGGWACVRACVRVSSDSHDNVLPQTYTNNTIPVIPF